MAWRACAVNKLSSFSGSSSSSSSLAGAPPQSSLEERFAEANTTAEDSSAVSRNRDACVNAVAHRVGLIAQSEEQQECDQHDASKCKGNGNNETATAAPNTIHNHTNDRGDATNAAGLPLSADFKGILEGTVNSPHSQQSTMMHGHPRPLRPRSNQPSSVVLVGNDNDAPRYTNSSPNNAVANSNCKYTRLLPLGSGSYGEAWVIRRNSDGQFLAAKVMRLSTADRRIMQRAESEVQCLQACRHFACLSFVEHFQEGDRLLIIVEYCNAGDLASYINTCRQANQSPPEATIGIIILQLLLAVEHMHRKKIIHRDIKSQNVFLSTSGLVKLGDFGLSNEYDTISGDVANTFCGTPYYLAPEVWRRQRYGARADVWALGVIAYELITGRCPFTENNFKDLLASVINTAHPPIRDVLSGVTSPANGQGLRPSNNEIDASARVSRRQQQRESSNPSLSDNSQHQHPQRQRSVSDELIVMVDLMLQKDPKERPTAIELLRTPYMRKQLDEFIPIALGTDRVDEDTKQSITKTVAEVQEIIRKMDAKDREDEAAVAAAAHTIESGPSEVAASSDLFRHHHGHEPLLAFSYFHSASLSSLHRPQTKDSSVHQKICIEGFARKLKSDGSAVDRYLVLENGYFEVLGTRQAETWLKKKVRAMTTANSVVAREENEEERARERIQGQHTNAIGGALDAASAHNGATANRDGSTPKSVRGFKDVRKSRSYENSFVIEFIGEAKRSTVFECCRLPFLLVVAACAGANAYADVGSGRPMTAQHEGGAAGSSLPRDYISASQMCDLWVTSLKAAMMHEQQ